MADEVTKKKDGGAIFAALTAFEGMPEREQPEQQERDWGVDYSTCLTHKKAHFIQLASFDQAPIVKP